MQLVLQLHLMSSLQAWDASANVAQIGSIAFLLSFHPHSSMLISLDHFLSTLHHILQNMNKNYAVKIFNKFPQNAVIISNFVCKFTVNQF